MGSRLVSSMCLQSKLVAGQNIPLPAPGGRLGSGLRVTSMYLVLTRFILIFISDSVSNPMSTSPRQDKNLCMHIR